MTKQKSHYHKTFGAALALALTCLPNAGHAAPTVRDVRDTVQVIPIKLDTEAKVPIKKGETLHLLRLYHDNGNAWSWNEYLAFEPCPRDSNTLCAMPFLDARNSSYSLRDTLHVDEDALTTVGFYTVQSAQGRWNLFMIRMGRASGDSSTQKRQQPPM